MANKTTYVCSACGAVAKKWSGQCEECGSWDTLQEQTAAEAAPKSLSASTKNVKSNALEFTDFAITGEPPVYRDSGINELDRVLGGGLVRGAAILVGGDPGIGKSTLLMQLVASCANSQLKTAYISGEESTTQLKLRAQRLNVSHAPVDLASATSVRDIITTFDKPNSVDVLIIDSIQTMYVDIIESSPGTITQVRASSFELIRMAKRRGITLFIVGHITKDGQIAGPKVMEHMVDTVLYFEGDRGYNYRILRSIKNRFGGTDEIGVFEMTGKGLQEVKNPSALFMSDTGEPTPGSAILASIEGTRPIMVETQALIADSFMASPRRAVVGWDTNRLAMVLAVIDSRSSLKVAGKEVYLNIAGGLKVNEPAADLAVAAAIISSTLGKALPNKCCFFGELGLSGDLRPVNHTDLRLKEAAKLGFNRAYIPASTKKISTRDIEVVSIKTINELVEMF